jgi:hypothetical protein
MRMHRGIHTLPNRSPEPNGVRKQQQLRTRLWEVFQLDPVEFVHGSTAFLPG